jgi:hypothetical protein
MDRDQVWEKIKNDNSQLYGQPILDVFLQTTDSLSEPHFLELNKNQIDKLTGDTIYSLLYYASDINKIADLIGHNINKISVNHVYTLLEKDENDIKNINIYNGLDAALEKRKSYQRRDAIFQYKNINNDRDIYSLLSYIPYDLDYLNKTIEKIGEEKLNYLEPHSILRLLKNFLNFDDSGDAFELFANKLGSGIEKIPADKVIELIPAPSTKPDEGTDRLEKVMKSLGKENLSKLEDKSIKSLLSHGSMKLRKKISGLLGQEINKLSDGSIDELVESIFININKDPNALAKMVDVVGEERFINWLDSTMGKETISSFKNGINMAKNEILKKAQSWQAPTLKNNIEIKEQMLDSLYKRLGRTND